MDRVVYAYNAVGSVVANTDQQGFVIRENDFDAYGNQVREQDWESDNFPTEFGGSSNDLLFSTKERDFSTGLDYFGFRYYDAVLGKFTTRDPSGYPDGPNNYLYVNNNPINSIDPLGLSAETENSIFNVIDDAANYINDFLESANSRTREISFEYNEKTEVYKIKGYVTKDEFANLTKFITRLPKKQRGLLNSMKVHLPFLKEADFSKVIQFINGMMNPDKAHKASLAPLMASGNEYPIFHLPNTTATQLGSDIGDWSSKQNWYNPTKHVGKALSITTTILGTFVDLVECQLFKGNIDIQGQQANNAAISEGLLQAFHEVLAIPHSEGGIIYSGSLDRHDILDPVTVKKNDLKIMHIGAAAQFGYDDYNKTIDVKGYTSVSKLFIADPVSILVGNGLKSIPAALLPNKVNKFIGLDNSNILFRPKDAPLFWSHGNAVYFSNDTPFMKDFGNWRKK